MKHSKPFKGAASGPDKGTAKRLRDVWPEILEMVYTRKRILALGFVLMVVNRVCGLVLPVSSKYLIDDVLVPRNAQALTRVLLAVLAATIIQGGTSFALTQIMSRAGQSLIAELRMKVQGHIGRLPVAFYDANKTGTLVARIMNDIQGVRNLLGTGIFDFIGSLLTAGIVLTLLFRISAVVTLVALTLLIIFIFGLLKMLEKVRPIFRERWQINAEVTGRLTESIGGVRVIKGYHAEEQERQAFARGVRRILDNIFKSMTVNGVLIMAGTLLTGLVSITIMYFGAQQIFIGRLLLGDFIKYATLMAFLIAPVFQIISIGTEITEALAGLDRTREVLNETPEDEDLRRTVTLPAIAGLVEFDHVSFHYEAGKRVLNDISLVAGPDTVTALVGPSGAGKSTIISLVAAFHTPQSGTVRIDSLDLSTIRLDSYRTQLGVVLQEIFLFDGTIWENVAFVRPDAREKEILDACRIACVDQFAERFADGYDTIIGERGVKLSGGERQRISIARAILARPRILILDEATSSLDSESEALIQRGLRHLMMGRTTFVIAHRLSTIRRANRILVVEEGCIVESGAHDELFAAKGRYWDLYTKQQGLVSDLFLETVDTESISTTPEESLASVQASGPDMSQTKLA